MTALTLEADFTGSRCDVSDVPKPAVSRCSIGVDDGCNKAVVMLRRQGAYVRSLSQGTAFLAASLIAIVAAVSFATTHASNYVADLVLRNVGPYNLRFGFVYGTFLLFAVTATLLAWRPNRLPFALKAMALFLVVRAVFVSLTHIAPSPIDPQKAAPFLNSMFYGSDQFFSGHTGMPFLAALCFWHL